MGFGGSFMRLGLAALGLATGLCGKGGAELEEWSRYRAAMIKMAAIAAFRGVNMAARRGSILSGLSY